jgi:alkylhydroperoxidase/carboxymuconolactone decarboxylase family protein YurZ
MSTRTELEDELREFLQGGDPILEQLARINLDALHHGALDERTAIMVRFAALVALDASPASYLVHLALAEQSGIESATIRAVLSTLAPLVGSARVVSAADSVRRALQLA